MPSLKDNLRGWRDAAEIDWFSHFIKAWIPFNAWMTDSFGDLTDRELIDKVKSGSNVVFNRIVPMLDPKKDSSQEAQEFRLQVAELHRLLQGCIVKGRRGEVSFESVDIGHNSHSKEHVIAWKRTFTVERDVPAKGNVTLTVSATKSTAAFSYTQTDHNRRELEDEPTFQVLKIEHRARLLDMHSAVAPRLVRSVIASSDTTKVMKLGNIEFVADTSKIFSALVDVIYSLRNALFHGSITPNEQHNEIYEPAYHIVMRLVRCTV
jgi:hypothetical protein